MLIVTETPITTGTTLRLKHKTLNSIKVFHRCNKGSHSKYNVTAQAQHCSKEIIIYTVLKKSEDFSNWGV